MHPNLAIPMHRNQPVAQAEVSFLPSGPPGSRNSLRGPRRCVLPAVYRMYDTGTGLKYDKVRLNVNLRKSCRFCRAKCVSSLPNRIPPIHIAYILRALRLVRARCDPPGLLSHPRLLTSFKRIDTDRFQLVSQVDDCAVVCGAAK